MRKIEKVAMVALLTIPLASLPGCFSSGGYRYRTSSGRYYYPNNNSSSYHTSPIRHYQGQRTHIQPTSPGYRGRSSGVIRHRDGSKTRFGSQWGKGFRRR